jgi:hypothetical protein
MWDRANSIKSDKTEVWLEKDVGLVERNEGHQETTDANLSEMEAQMRSMRSFKVLSSPRWISTKPG